MRLILTSCLCAPAGIKPKPKRKTDFTRFSGTSVPSNCELGIAPICTSNRPLLHDDIRELPMGAVGFISICDATLKDKTRSVQGVEIV